MDATGLIGIDEKKIGISPAKAVYVKDKKFKNNPLFTGIHQENVAGMADVKKPPHPRPRSPGK